MRKISNLLLLFVLSINLLSAQGNDNDIVNMSLSVLRGDNYTQSTTPGMISTPLNFNGSLTVDIQILDGSGGAAIYIVASVRAGDWLNLSGSLFFFLATVCFIIPHYWDHKERSDD